YDADDVNAGLYDSYLANWFATSPTAYTWYWTYYHEPEDNIASGQFTATAYRNAWIRIKGIADANTGSNDRATLTLMSWTANRSSGRNWLDYYAGASYVDVVSWDIYPGFPNSN